MTIQKSEALAYHFGARPGKIEVSPKSPAAHNAISALRTRQALPSLAWRFRKTLTIL